MKRFAILSIRLVVAACVVNACSSATETNPYPCDPKAILPASACVKQNSGTEDAGTDAESDAATDGKQSAIDDPGLESSVFSTCKTDCVPEASGPTALDWTNEPLIVWFGPRSELDKKSCPGGLSYEKVRGFDNLVAPPAKCDACACLADGSCTGLPATIEIQSGKCNSNVQTTPFEGPPNWDGSCTSANAMAMGKLCNGVLCAQSVSTSPLPAPTNESCTPTVEKPHATLDKHEWLEGAIACRAKDLGGTCAVTPQHCVDLLPDDGWQRCIARSGKHNECPGNYNDSGPYWVYQDNPIDDRDCSACSCGAPKDGVCIASLRLYSDASCNMELNNNILSSIEPFCVDLTTPGLALGAKTISNFSYVLGTCGVTGGEPVGTVVPNDDEMSGVVTFCCRAPAPPPLPPPR